MADLVSGLYPQHQSLAALFGNQTNVVQSNVPAYTNYFGSAITDTSGGTSGSLTVVAVPCDPGIVITNVTRLIGGTASSTPTHQFVALYQGLSTAANGALLASSADATTAAIAASSAAYKVALSSAYLVKPADVPNGYLYVGFTETATTFSTCMSWATATAVQIQYFTSMPFLSGTASITTAGTANATIGTITAKATAPVVVLT